MLSPGIAGLVIVSACVVDVWLKLVAVDQSIIGKIRGLGMALLASA